MERARRTGAVVELTRMSVDLFIRLDVFGHNTAARSLYDELGYVATNIMMRKRLTQPSASNRK